MNCFERRDAHRAFEREGELSIERFGELWAETQHAMLGDSVELTPGYLTWWSYIPHFIGTPGCRCPLRLRTGLVLSVYALATREWWSGFCAALRPRWVFTGSKSPETPADAVDHLADPQFWGPRLDIIERRLEATIEAATAAGRLA